MCLNLVAKKSQEEDIKCYKVLTRTEDGKTLLSPVFSTMTWEVGETYHLGVNKPHLSYDENYIEGNAFHTFEDRNDAEKFKCSFRPLPGHVNVVAECTIPKSSKFLYTGVTSLVSWPFYEKGYASEALRIDKIL